MVIMGCEEMVFSVEPQKVVPAPFLTKTYQLVDDPVTDHIVSWGEDETTFVVWRPPEFARDLLPNYFKHNNFSSFVRQLNTYGFKKIVADRWEFANEYFRKGAKHLLLEIHRRKNAQNHPHHHHHHQQEIIERLRRRNYMLLSELTHMKNLYNDIIFFIQNHVKPAVPCEYDEHGLTVHSYSEPRLRELIKSSSAAVTEEPNGTVKLFGVALSGKKRLHPGKVDEQELE
ncbi:hypothetical protein Patl1_29367 [Pistacia atlantica]|uniref:Uncharacterized protein n=1 Tax=Pistacia atlantica TaxID=434234 RepID=A0ACC1AEP6_9ROSI|nr:hypothetical protein Patl1_29367 [Pistacia atlantica]